MTRSTRAGRPCAAWRRSNGGGTQAADVAKQHEVATCAVEDERPDTRALSALPPAQVAPRRLPDLRHVQRPPGRPGLTRQDATTTVAVDLLGGDGAPGVVVGGAALALEADAALRLRLVGPPDAAHDLLGGLEPELRARADVVPATEVVEMSEDPARAVRSKRDATVRVAARLVRDGGADAFVSVGSTGAAMAAALFTLGRLPGVTRPALAVVVPAAGGPLVLLDAGATVEASPDLLAQFACAGAAYATTALGISRPKVGLLSVGSEPGKGDPARKAAAPTVAAALSGLPIEYVGNVEGGDVPLGGLGGKRADVVVTDGFTGNVLLKGLEGMLGLVGHAIGGAGEARLPAAFAEAVRSFDPEVVGGGILLGVDGVSIVGHGASSPRAVASCIRLATAAVSDGLIARLTSSLAELVRWRRGER